MKPERKEGIQNNTKIILCGQVHPDPLPFKLQQQLVEKLVNNGVKVIVASENPETLDELRELKKEDCQILEDIEALWPHLGIKNNKEFHKILTGLNFKSQTMAFARAMTLEASPLHLAQDIKQAIKGMIMQVCVIPKEFEDDINFLKARFVSDRNSSKEIYEFCKFIKEKKIEFVPLENRALIEGCARASQYLGVSDQHRREFVKKYENPRIAHMKDALMKTYHQNQHAVIIVMNLGKVHLQRLAAHLVLSGVNDKNLTMLEFFPSDEILKSIHQPKAEMLTSWENVESLKKYDQENIQKLYESMHVHKIKLDCNNNKDRTITSRGEFEEIEKEILTQHVPLVRVELNRDFLENEAKLVGGIMKGKVLEIRADKLDKALRDNLNLTKQKINTPLNDGQKKLFEQNGIAVMNDNHNGSAFIFCDKNKLDLVKDIVSNKHSYSQKEVVAVESKEQTLADSNNSAQFQKTSPSPSPSLTKFENKDFLRPLTSSKEKSTCERITGCSVS